MQQPPCPFLSADSTPSFLSIPFSLINTVFAQIAQRPILKSHSARDCSIRLRGRRGLGRAVEKVQQAAACISMNTIGPLLDRVDIIIRH